MGDYDRYSHLGAECPYCGHMNLASDSDGGLYDEGRSEWECDACEDEFLVSPNNSWTWTTAPKEPPHDQ